jgi:hypothetical protein
MLRVLALLVVLLTAVAAFAQSQQDAKALVQEMVQNELRARKDDHSHWMYVDSLTEDSTTTVNDVIETSSGTLELLVSENGQMVSGQQKSQEISKLEQSIQNPKTLKKGKQETDEDSKKATEMLQMLPEAFLYTLVDDNGPLIHLRFLPNPDFTPPTHEATVFHAMAGDMFIDKKEKRLAELSGRLMSNVYFGWGILGKLMQGGTFRIKQKEVGPEHWELTLLDVHITGRALLFKTIGEQQHETRTEYRQVPNDLTPQQAVAMLQNSSAQVAYQHP